MIGRDRGGSYHHFGAVGLEHVSLVLTDLVRADEHGTVTLALSDECETNAGIARCGLDERAARLQRTCALSLFYHRELDAVFRARGGIQVLDLGQNGGAQPLSYGVEAHQRRVSDQVDNVLGKLHGSYSPRRGAGQQMSGRQRLIAEYCEQAQQL